MPPLVVEPIACLQDNYAYLVRAHADAREAILVDASEAAPVQRALAASQRRLVGILSTHHHRDHVGANEALCAQPDLWGPGGPVVVGSAHDVAACRIPRATRALADGESISLAGASFRCLLTPGHTMGAACFVVDAGPAVFTGDTLFLGGCGRLFEGDAPTMWRSLLRLRALPAATLVYCGHEYTQKNSEFALYSYPADPAVQRAHRAATALREAGRPTVPSPMSEQTASNLFLRADEPALQRHLGVRGAEAAFADLRSRRDAF